MVISCNPLSIEEAAQGFAAIGPQALLSVVLALVRAGRSGLSVGDIQARTGMAASTLAHHLRFLASAGLIEQEKDGRSVINRAAFERLKALADLALGADRLTAGGSRAARSGPGLADRRNRAARWLERCPTSSLRCCCWAI